MISAIALRNVVRAPVRAPISRSIFSFKNDMEILSDDEQQGGRRKEELDAEKQGKVAFNRDPIFPPAGAGTKENPIEVPSGYDERAVGYECPHVHQLFWFNLTKGPLHYVPNINMYFKLVEPSQE
mmetsp:Transcript_47486/g.60977  ORF Transcript_47486/g.60977 Transcript_47486/m.60977 type:complete len:125 (-) Transcript_47486:263-637(-)